MINDHQTLVLVVFMRRMGQPDQCHLGLTQEHNSITKLSKFKTSSFISTILMIFKQDKD